MAFADMADSAYNAMVGPLAGLFNFSSGVQTALSKEMSKTSIRLEFLAELYKGFSWGKPALLQLDGIPTSLISSLISRPVAQTTPSTKLSVSTKSCASTSPATKQTPSSTWHWITNKAKHTSNTFNMRYAVVDCDLNVNKYLASKGNLNTVFQSVNGKTMQELPHVANTRLQVSDPLNALHALKRVFPSITDILPDVLREAI
ncbi:hypothetical protein F4678DRAFT_480633 [Xylaria arbuscula]|nr:hypothetical protein F4678DRAFT_480633 [Xylaria arbuscula]